MQSSKTRPPRDELGQDVVESLVAGTHGDVFSVLGMHPVGPGHGVVVRAWLPGADQVSVIDAGSGELVVQLDRRHSDGLFSARIPDQRQPFRYRLQLTDASGVREMEDPYRFPSSLGATDLYLLGEGSHLRAYEQLGAHPCLLDSVSGVRFAVWAPSAMRVSVVGDFNHWDGRWHVMRNHPGVGVWELFVPGVVVGMAYKYELRAADGRLLPLKADPYGQAMEQPPRTASLIVDDQPGQWQDEGWMERRQHCNDVTAPISIYEVHLGSWRRVESDGNRYLSYREMADQLLPYVRDMGFTHLQLMPVSEYPFDGSWGYQPIGLFAPTSRFGSPVDFAWFVDRCHAEGLGLLIDWVPGHFPTDAHGLGRFDGSCLFEHEDPRKGFHQDWNTLIYNYGRTEVANFLISNALFWLERFHVDGLRVDAVASMLYLDYSREEGQWLPNRFGGRENLEAVAFLRRVNELAYELHPGIVTIAEESTAWSGVSRPTWLGGLGFGFKWNMGWMNDTLSYFSRDPIHRRYHHNDLTFGLLYAFSENFVLPLSHDEVVHGKGSLLARMPGDSWQQFANLRAYYGFMWAHPGKKLLFMGGEFAQSREWNHDRQLDWELLDIDWHQGVQKLVRDLNHLYRELPALHRLDCKPEGFSWVEASDSEHSTLAWLRHGGDGTATVLVVCNLTPVVHERHRVGVPHGGYYRERLNTDAAIYGGSNVGNQGGIAADSQPWQTHPFSLRMTLPPLATLIFEHAAG